jgi:hypothetical protein
MKLMQIGPDFEILKENYFYGLITFFSIKIRKFSPN